MSTRQFAFLFLLIASTILFSGCGSQDSYPNRPITIVCPWGAGGGTDRVSREMAVYLKSELDVPVNVINATGGQGVSGHARGLLARPDGYTISMMTLELNMLHWRGLTDLTWQDSEPLMSLNEDPAAVLVRADSQEFKTILDVAAAVKANPGKLKASGTASLGAWHLALAGWLISIDQDPNDIVWIPSQGSNPSLLELMSGTIDLVCCSVPEAESLIAAGEVRCLGVMADKRLDSDKFKMHPTLKEEGSDWTLTGWRALGVPKGTPEPIRKKLLVALKKIVTGKTVVQGQTFPEFMDAQGFDRTWRAEDDLTTFLDSNDQELGNILTSEAFKSVKGGPVGPMIFPWVAFGVFMFSVLGIGIQAMAKRRASSLTVPTTESEDGAGSSNASTSDAGVVELLEDPATLNWKLFFFVVVAIIGFVMVADSVGFILTAMVFLTGFSLMLKARPVEALTLGVVAAPLIYHMFSRLLGVPLPIGWFGW